MAYFLSPFVVSIVLIILGRILWIKGNQNERVIEAIGSCIVDVFSGKFASSKRTLAILLYLIALFAILVGLIRIVNS